MAAVLCYDYQNNVIYQIFSSTCSMYMYCLLNKFIAKWLGDSAVYFIISTPMMSYHWDLTMTLYHCMIISIILRSCIYHIWTLNILLAHVNEMRLITLVLYLSTAQILNYFLTQWKCVIFVSIIIHKWEVIVFHPIVHSTWWWPQSRELVPKTDIQWL